MGSDLTLGKGCSVLDTYPSPHLPMGTVRSCGGGWKGGSPRPSRHDGLNGTTTWAAAGHLQTGWDLRLGVFWETLPRRDRSQARALGGSLG